MSSNDIYRILASKPHNPHYLNRYYNFIISCVEMNSNCCDNVEAHHICPKSTDLFPEYECLKTHSWNNANLTYRQHFIAHWMLWKAYGGKQAYAFMCMTNNMNPKQMHRITKRTTSKVYEAVKRDSTLVISKSNRGKAAYKDIHDNKIYCRTDDPRVLSGELISTTTGRKMPPRTKEYRKQLGIRSVNMAWERRPVRKITLYFLDMQLVIEYTRDDFKFLPYLDQGWVPYVTPEWTSKSKAAANVRRFERKITEQMRRGDYSSFEYMYDTVDKVVFMGVKAHYFREYGDRYTIYGSRSKFKHYKDILTGRIHQIDPNAFPILENFKRYNHVTRQIIE